MTSTAPIDLRGSTKEIEDSYIGGGSRGSYLNTLVQLIIFLYDSPRKELLFSAANLLKLQEAHAKDEPPPAESGGMDVEWPGTLKRRREGEFCVKHGLKFPNKKVVI